MRVPNSEIFTADYPITSPTQMVGQGAILGMLRSDGIDDGYNVIQGVRSYDPSAGTWTTPDAYAGEVHDPRSQKAYMWNKNDPVLYADPNGYVASVTQVGNVVFLTFFVTFKPDPGVTIEDEKTFVSNVQNRLSGQAGEFKVITRVVESGAGSPLEVVVHLESPTLARGHNPRANGEPGGHDVWVGTEYFSDASRTSGAQAHELFHTAYNNMDNGFHSRLLGDIMSGMPGPGLSTGSLSQGDVQKAIDCSCNTFGQYVDDPRDTGGDSAAVITQ